MAWRQLADSWLGCDSPTGFVYRPCACLWLCFTSASSTFTHTCVCISLKGAAKVLMQDTAAAHTVTVTAETATRSDLQKLGCCLHLDSGNDKADAEAVYFSRQAPAAGHQAGPPAGLHQLLLHLRQLPQQPTCMTCLTHLHPGAVSQQLVSQLSWSAPWLGSCYLMPMPRCNACERWLAYVVHCTGADESGHDLPCMLHCIAQHVQPDLSRSSTAAAACSQACRAGSNRSAAPSPV